MPGELIRQADVARIFGCDTSHIITLIEKKRLTSTKDVATGRKFIVMDYLYRIEFDNAQANRVKKERRKRERAGEGTNLHNEHAAA